MVFLVGALILCKLCGHTPRDLCTAVHSKFNRKKTWEFTVKRVSDTRAEPLHVDCASQPTREVAGETEKTSTERKPYKIVMPVAHTYPPPPRPTLVFLYRTSGGVTCLHFLAELCCTTHRVRGGWRRKKQKRAFPILTRPVLSLYTIQVIRYPFPVCPNPGTLIFSGFQRITITLAHPDEQYI